MTDPYGTMEITVSRAFKINMGNFENSDSFAAIKVTVPIDRDIEEIANDLAEKLDTIQYPDILQAHNLTSERRSFVHHLVSDEN